MKHWTTRQLTALVLGVMFALGTTLSSVQAAEMAVAMSADASMGTEAAPGGCGPCGGDDEAASMDSCVMVCPSSTQAVAPAADPVVITKATKARPLGEFVLAGRISDPDPYPPKPAALI